MTEIHQDPASLAVDIQGLVRRYGRQDAVRGLDLQVRKGRCYGLFGRNGAGKTTTIKCLLDLLRPTEGTIKVLGLDPSRDEVAVRSRLSYVPDTVAFYPWMSVTDTLRFAASFRPQWNTATEKDLLNRLELDPLQRAQDLSKGQKTQLALIAAICPEPELLVLDEPTSGLDPIVRREFIETVIGAYQSGDPEHRTVLVSTHLITEFEGLIDEFTIVEKGRSVLTMESDEARSRFHRLRARFAGEPPESFSAAGVLSSRTRGRELELTVEGSLEAVREQVRALQPESCETESLSLEEIFIASSHLKEKVA